jgi:Transposase DDE domain
MRPRQSTLRAETVHAYARRLLVDELRLRDYKRSVPAGRLADLLLLAAGGQTSLSAACARCRGAPSREAARQALRAALPSRPLELLGRLLGLLRRGLPEHLRRRPLVCALDIHGRPYYGRPTRGTSRGQEKRSTKKAFAYATLAAYSDAGRFTVALIQVREHMRLTTIVARLVAQAREAGVSIAYLLLDKEFYSAEVIAWLQGHGVPFLMPMVRKDGPKGNGHFFRPETAVGWYEYGWTSRPRRRDFKAKKRHRRGLRVTVQVQVCVARHPCEEGRRLVYASWGLGKWAPVTVVCEYRRRFGIEVSYRQLGQCLAQTTSKGERVRLLLVGLALFWGNLWAWLHSEAFSTGPVGKRRLALAACRLRALAAAVIDVTVTLLGGPVKEWTTQRPLPPPLALLEVAA